MLRSLIVGSIVGVFVVANNLIIALINGVHGIPIVLSFILGMAYGLIGCKIVDYFRGFVKGSL